ncbi:TonB-dependent receptor [Flavobacterium zepuense]|uniref:TonB-dependent receptor n=1 Tax=Flavobacterium zepuense TaxID=2593302 RepID=A0A552V9X8_9FLAO|nr:TonB-dependent receptor [Flavobacterium zepuense]TRW27275.1 TonB-dependent receptor [Flavobacterium zepuense]
MRSLLFLTILLFNIQAFAQIGAVTGNVVFENNDVAYGVTVLVKGTQKYATVNETGSYEIKGLTYGIYVLEVSSLEAQTKTVNVTVNSPIVQLNITVQKNNPKQLDEVVVSKISAKKEILDKGFSVNVIETHEAAKRNIQTNDLLDRSVGVRVRQNGGLGASVDYNLNGMSGNSIRVFIDGIPISTYGASFNLNSIPPALIERIEVYKGVIPAYLADDALGGAINVILKRGVRNTLNASVSYGSFNTVQSNLSTSYRAENGFTVKASGFQNYSDNDYEVWGKFVYNILPNGRYEYVRAKRFNNLYRSYGGRVEAGFTDVKWADLFLVGYNGSEDYNQIQHGQFMTKPYKGRFTESDAQALSLNYTKKDFLVKGLDFNFNGVYSLRNEVVNDTVKWNYNWNGERALGLYGDPILTPNGAQQGAPTINNIKRNVVSLRGGFNYRINDNHKIIFSNMYNSVNRDDNDELKSALEKRFLETRDLRKSVSSLAYELQAFESSLRTSIFGKYYSQTNEKRDPILVSEGGQTNVVEEVVKNTTDIFGYGLAVSYFITPQVMLLASAEKAVRLPSDNEIFGSPGENITSNPTLRPEISNNINAGFRLGAYKFNKHKISVAASGFWRNTDDKIVRQINDRINDAIQTLPFENLREAQSLGVEASLEYVYNERLFININMSKFRSLYKLKYDNNGNVLDNYNKQLPNEPFFTLNGNAQYNFKSLIQKESELNVYYACGYVAPFYTSWLELESSQTPTQFAQDLGVSYTFPAKQFIVSFDAKNIFNQQVYDNYAVQKPGRAFYVKLNYTINKF